MICARPHKLFSFKHYRVKIKVIIIIIYFVSARKLTIAKQHDVSTTSCHHCQMNNLEITENGHHIFVLVKEMWLKLRNFVNSAESIIHRVCMGNKKKSIIHMLYVCMTKLVLQRFEPKNASFTYGHGLYNL